MPVRRVALWSRSAQRIRLWVYRSIAGPETRWFARPAYRGIVWAYRTILRAGHWIVRPKPLQILVWSLAIIFVVNKSLEQKWFSVVTLSVTAKTEVLQFDLLPNEQLEWQLPKGRYALFDPQSMVPIDEEGEPCKIREHIAFDDYLCEFEEQTRLFITNGDKTLAVRVRVEISPSSSATNISSNDSPGPALHISIRPISIRASKTGSAEEENEAPPPRTWIEVLGSDGKTQFSKGKNTPMTSGDVVNFDAYSVRDWRVPLTSMNMTIGEALSYGSDRQPILTEGDVRIYASTKSIPEIIQGMRDPRAVSSNNSGNLPARRRYLILEEAFDAADIVHIVQRPGPEDEWNPLSGLLAVGRDNDSRLTAAGILEITVHANAEELTVERLGAQHAIRATTWDLLSRQPLWIAIWVLFASLLLVVSTALDLTSTKRTANVVRRFRHSRKINRKFR